MSSVEKYSNVLGDKKEAVFTTPLSEKKSLTKYVDKVTEELEDMKEAVITIHRKDSDNFEGRYKGSTGWFNLDSLILKRKFSTIEPDFYKNLYENYIEGQDMEPYRTFFVPFYK